MFFFPLKLKYPERVACTYVIQDAQERAQAQINHSRSEEFMIKMNKSDEYCCIVNFTKF